MERYNVIAPLYDRVMGDRTAVAQQVHKLIKGAHPRAQSVLEVGCGTGSILAHLQRFYTVSGLDRSGGMLKIAQKKVPKASLIHQDMSQFRLKAKFDVILCIFDTVNHLPKFNLWQRLFRRVYEHLNEGGVFIFDVNTPYKIKKYGEELPYAMTGPSSDMCVTDIIPTKRNSYLLHVRFFSPDKNKKYSLYEEAFPGAAYPKEKIKRELLRYFRRIKIQDPERPRPTATSEELYFICSRAK